MCISVCIYKYVSTCTCLLRLEVDSGYFPIMLPLDLLRNVLLLILELDNSCALVPISTS